MRSEQAVTVLPRRCHLRSGPEREWHVVRAVFDRRGWTCLRKVQRELVVHREILDNGDELLQSGLPLQQHGALHSSVTRSLGAGMPDDRHGGRKRALCESRHLRRNDAGKREGGMDVMIRKIVVVVMFVGTVCGCKPAGTNCRDMECCMDAVAACRKRCEENRFENSTEYQRQKCQDACSDYFPKCVTGRP